ncbi:thioredoxin family protein [Pontibacter sp. SGAir0037]|uniref:thioredoxin family protein n=1 Tax=Pontibacter sp. SGAir0037 TaxID=2571030 RepID=UPI0010CD4FC9|nr:thioredoxin family protein [Pontibacter sp. SGAir0037]QCR24269.1 thiol reductase thioredoxin [Pontibacter sp. SGAir0037]
MTILESNDKELRQLIFQKPKVIVKFTDENCPICKQLHPKFNLLSTAPEYEGITFVRMNAKENPVSSKEVKLTGTPFFAIYREGKLVDCGIAATEQELRKMLQALL